MNTKTCFLMLILILLFAGGTRSNSPISAQEQGRSVGSVQGSAEKTQVLHSKSIPALRQREYSAENFRLLGAVPARKGLYAQEFSYISEGNLNYGLIERPAEKAPLGGWPVIVVAHGYIPPNSYSTVKNYRLVTRYYAANGFLVVKPDYRGHGRSEGRRDRSLTYTIDYSIDVLNLLAGLGNIPHADTDNVFLYGHSMGGEISLRILEIDKTIKGASLWASVTQDYPENMLYYQRRRSPAGAAERKKLIDQVIKPYNFASMAPSTYLESIKVPLIIHHGTADESVPFEWSVSFRQNLDEAGVDYAFYEYPGQNHNISKSFYTVLDRDMAFFRKIMGKS